jgi:hypothetical protein
VSEKSNVLASLTLTLNIGLTSLDIHLASLTINLASCAICWASLALNVVTLADLWLDFHRSCVKT